VVAPALARCAAVDARHRDRLRNTVHGAFGAVFSQVDFPHDPVVNVEIWGTRFLPYLDNALARQRRLATPRLAQ
jgi:hypothetical protein